MQQAYDSTIRFESPDEYHRNQPSKDAWEIVKIQIYWIAKK